MKPIKKWHLWDKKGTRKTFDSEDEMFVFISNYLKEKNFDSPYYRLVTFDDGSIMLDYGSHTHFFYYMTLQHGEGEME
jgi:hypothetical protein